MYVTVREFHVRAELAAKFERTYGPGGEWVRMFSAVHGYLRSELCLDLDRPGRYLVKDYWTSRESFEHFLAAHAAEYDALDRQCTTLTETETNLGAFLCIIC